MEAKKVFEKYYSRLRREGILKALIGGAIIGFAAMFVAAFVTWCLPNVDGLWLSIGAGVLFMAIGTVVLYFKRFRPTARKIAARIDGLGLEERLITMLELEKDESYIAMRQREDAMEQLSKVDKKSVKFYVSKAMVCAVAVAFVLGVGMAVVTGLNQYGVIEDPTTLISSALEEEIYYSVSYIAEDGGYIDGEEDQLVLEGESGETVTAVAESGYAFDGWSDGYTRATRAEADVQNDIELTAYFIELEDGLSGEGEGDGEGENEGDGLGSGSGSGESEGEGEGGDGEGEGDGDSPGDGAGGGAGENDQVIDGETDYSDVSGEYRDSQDSSELPDGSGGVVDDYFGSL